MAISKCPYCGNEIEVVVRTIREINGPTPHIYESEIENLIVWLCENPKISFKKASDILMERGILTPKGYKQWYPATVKRLYEGILKRKDYEKVN